MWLLTSTYSTLSRHKWEGTQSQMSDLLLMDLNVLVFIPWDEANLSSSTYWFYFSVFSHFDLNWYGLPFKGLRVEVEFYASVDLTSSKLGIAIDLYSSHLLCAQLNIISMLKNVMKYIWTLHCMLGVSWEIKARNVSVSFHPLICAGLEVKASSH